MIEPELSEPNVVQIRRSFSPILSFESTTWKCSDAG
jgi:hypothetical protein